MRLFGYRLADQLTTVATASNSSNDALNAFVGLIMVLLVLGLYFTPFIIALLRGHSYKWVIFGLNAIGFSGITWLISFVWAVWPAEKSLIDPIAGNVTGTGRRNVGDTLGSVEYGKERGFNDESQK